MKKIVLLIFILSLTGFGQKPTPKPVIKTVTEKDQKLALQKLQVVSMVEKTAEEAIFWEDKKAAVETMAEAADLLWEENPTNAVKWLTKAWKTIGEVSDSPKNEKLRQFFTTTDKTNLQTMILKVALNHDEQLAEKFLKQLTENEADEKKEKGAFDDKTARSEQLLRLAQQAVETNPSLAFSLAERSLVDGISFGLQNVLTGLRKKDVNLANRLFDEALARFNNTSSDTSEAQIFVGYLFKPGFTMGTNSSGGTILVVNPAQENLPAVANSEPNRTNNFLNSVYQKFFARPIVLDTTENKRNAESIMLLGNSVVGYYDRFAPESAQPAKEFLIQLQSQLYPNRQNQSSDNESRLSKLPKNATKEEIYDALIADLEEKADKETDSIAKKIAYVKAALSTNPEDYKRGVAIAKKIDDDNLNEDAVSFILYRAALFFVEKKEISTAEEIAPQIKETLRRSVVKTAIAQFLLQPSSKKLEQFQADLRKQKAVGLLDETEKDLRKEDTSLNSVKALLGMTSVLAKLDRTQAISSLENIIQKINKLESFNIKQTSAPNLGIDISSTSSATVSTPKIGFGFRNAIEPLIETDFDQITSIIERISAKQVRGVGRIEFAKIFFQKNKNLLKAK